MAKYRHGNSKEDPRCGLNAGIKAIDELDPAAPAANGNSQWFIHLSSFPSYGPVRFSLGNGLLEPEGCQTPGGIDAIADDP